MKLHNILLPPDVDYNHQKLYLIGLKQSLKEHRNVILVHSDLIHFSDLPQKQFIRRVVGRRTYHFVHEEAVHHNWLTPTEIIQLCHYPKQLFRYQPFFMLMIAQADNLKPSGLNDGRWEKFFTYFLRQIMYYVENFPNANQNGLDIIIFDLNEIPLIPALSKYLKEARHLNIRFLIGANHSCQQYYTCSPETNAEMDIFRYSLDYNLMSIDDKEEHRAHPKLTKFW